MKLKLNQVRAETPYIQNRGNAILHLSDRADIKEGTIIIDYDVHLLSGINLQRLFVWTLEQKQNFILSILKGIDIPKVAIWKEYISKKEEILTGKTFLSRDEVVGEVWHVIDGKQRISSFLDFLNGIFPVIVSGKEYYLQDFDDNLISVVNSFTFKADIAWREITDRQKVEWFNLINFSGTPQEKTHIDNLLNSVK